MTHDEKRQQRHAAANSVKSGNRPEVVAAKFGKAVSWVYTACAEFGVKFENGCLGRKHTRGMEILKLLYVDGMPPTKVAHKLNVTIARVCHVRDLARSVGWEV